MDIVHRQEKYQEYLKKIESAKDVVNDSMFRRSINDKIEAVLSDLKSRKDVSEYNAMLYLLIVPFVIVSIIGIIKFGGYMRFVPLILLAMYFIYFRMSMIGVIKIAKDHKLDTDNTVTNNEVLKSKIQYLCNGVDIKIKRLRLVRLLYTIFFPLFIVLLIELIKGEHIFGNLWISLGASYLICGTYWWLYFVGDIEDLNFTKESFDDDIIVLNDPKFVY